MDSNNQSGNEPNRNQQEQFQSQHQNRYAHLVTSTGGAKSAANRVHTFALADKQAAAAASNPMHATSPSQQSRPSSMTKAPPLREAAGLPVGNGHQQQKQHQHQQAKNYYYQSFSTRDWREQWTMLKEKTLEKVEEPECQRKLIMLIVCTALLLDNMLYMVIVPIIPDYLRSIGSWSTYTENARWILRNGTRGHPTWEQVGGQVVYEGEDSAVGFLFASKAIVQLIANPFSGAIADRIGYEIPMMFGLMVMFLSTMVFACGQTYSVLFLARSLQGVGSAFADTPGIALLADRFTEEKERRRAQGIAIAFISFGCLVAPPFGSVLYQGAGKEVPFILLSLVCLIDGSLLLLVCPPGTFSQILPKYYRGQPAPGQALPSLATRAGQERALVQSPVAPTPAPAPALTNQHDKDNQLAVHQQSSFDDQTERPDCEGDGGGGCGDRRRALKRQKSISRRHSMTVSAGGEAPKGTPIEVLLRDPCIACCAGALVVANVSLAFLEPTISIWVKNTMPETEEWQEGMIWLPAFFPHVLGVFATLHLAEKYPQATWKIAAGGLVIEGLGCLVVPFCASFWSLIIPISIICFGVALIDTAILPTLGYLVDTRFTSVYGNVYAIADISYSVSYAIGPIIAGGIVEAIGFTALNFLIAIVTLGYTPSLIMLRTIRDYKPFEADATGRLRDQARPFGQFGRKPIDEDEEEDDDEEAAAAAAAARKSSPPFSPYFGSQQQSQQQPPWSSNAGSGIRKHDSTPTGGGGPLRSQKSVKIIDSPRCVESNNGNTNPFQ